MLLNDFQPIAAIATTPLAAQTLRPLWETGAAVLWVPEGLVVAGAESVLVQQYRGNLREVLPELWGRHRSLVFGLAAGATVRLVAPLLTDKATDPAIAVVEASGRFVISLCGGHQGGADRLTGAIAHLLQSTPVLTGGANALGLPGIDVLGLPFGWVKGNGDWTGLSAAVARGETLQVLQTAGNSRWQTHLPPQHPFVFAAAAAPTLHITATLPPPAAQPQACWHPRVLWVGVGCERGTPQRVIATALQQVFQAHHLAEDAIAALCTIALKADEVGLLEFCRDRQLPLRCFAAAELQTVEVPNPSAVVAQEVGTPSVAEAAALLAAQRHSPLLAELAEPNHAPARLIVPKQIVRLPDQPGAVTIAIAQSAQELTGRSGQLWLVGTGPGQLDQITPAAQAAIAQADVVVGYSLYVDLIAALLRPGQWVEALPITQERQRAERAIALSCWGLTVAVISSGDCGIYGMAGLVLEELQKQDWDGKTPEVQVFPGISALQSAASRVGAPLMHDFCAISLSDLLTPWEVIEKRLQAAAQADFVVALYNPRSKTRTGQVAIAQRIFLQHRPADTPVALVRSAYRPDEQVTLATLETLLEQPIDMLTTVLIGNQSTTFHANWMITPRGYNKRNQPEYAGKTQLESNESGNHHC